MAGVTAAGFMSALRPGRLGVVEVAEGETAEMTVLQRRRRHSLVPHALKAPIN